MFIKRCFCFKNWCTILYTLIVIVFIFVTYALFVWDSNHPCVLPVAKRTRLAYMVKAFSEIMTELNVTHWVDFGTLLGALRYQNIIVWDHDGDVSYDQIFTDLLGDGSVAQKIAKKRYNIYLNADLILYENLQVDIFCWKKKKLSDGSFIYTKAVNRNLELWESQFNDFNASYIEKTVSIPFAGGFVKAPYPPMEFAKKRYPTSYNRVIPFKVSCYFPWNLPYWLIGNRPMHEIT